jgi:hypothetical protein
MLKVTLDMSDDDVLDYVQGQRKRVADQLTKDGIPEDRDTLEVLLSTLDGLGRTALGKKKVKSEENGNKNTMAAIEAMTMLGKQFGNDNPFLKGSNPSIAVEQQVDTDKLPTITTVEGEKEIGISANTYDDFTRARADRPDS